ncbi:hypothetical protein ACLOJK_019864 [Asimina triloba]
MFAFCDAVVQSLLGVFEMSHSGLQAVLNPSEMFLSENTSDSEVLAGLAVAVVIDGSRTFLVEVQALCSADSGDARHFNGVPKGRADMIITVLMKQAGLKLQNSLLALYAFKDPLSPHGHNLGLHNQQLVIVDNPDTAVFLNVVSGLGLTETGGDLAIAAAICSSFLEFPLPNNAAFIGEIGLGGELRTDGYIVPRMDKRVIAVAKLGYKKCFVPQSAEKNLSSLDLGETIIIGCKNMKEAIDKALQGIPMHTALDCTSLHVRSMGNSSAVGKKGIHCTNKYRTFAFPSNGKR